MTGLLLAFLAVLVCGIGAKDQLLIADLCRRPGSTASVLTIGIVCAIATSLLAGLAAQVMIPMMPTGARRMMGIIALAWAGLEALLLKSRVSVKEPSHSLGALAIVLFFHQITDVARMLVFAIAISRGAALPAAAGGAFGAVISIATVASMAEAFSPQVVALWRRIIGLGLIILALVVFLMGRT